MPHERDSTVASSGQGRLIAAAMNQVVAIRQAPREGADAGGQAVASPPAASGDTIPGYDLLEQIHRGGQGVVYKALQRSTHRHVAIKVLRDGAFSTPAEIARFEQEVRVLGRLRHPNIVRIYDSGSVGGRFHFVMDYVPGMALDAYVENVWLEGLRGLGIKNREQGTGNREQQTARSDTAGGVYAAERGGEFAATGKGISSTGSESASPGRGLVSGSWGTTPQSKIQSSKSKIETVVLLFEKVCDAVNAAHVRGIIHRDLKPGNIRVDETGEPFVLDFGLSKLTEDKSADMTLAGQFVGSLPWAAPEQAEGRIDAIDLRTDVYSLGVLFYRTLTGAFPYRVDGGLTDVLSQIAHADPAPPRTYVPSLPADLETIVLKCLQKDPDRRYQSAGELARDLGRLIRGEAIEARRDSMTYVLGMQLARYRVAALTAAAFAIVLVAALIATLAFWRDADAARADAVEKGRIASEKEAEALASARRARHESEAASAVADFLTQMITSVDPYEGGGHDTRVADTLDSATRRLDGGALAGHAELEGRVRRVLGEAYSSLGLNEIALEHARLSVALLAGAGDESREEYIRAAIELVTILRRMSWFDEAEVEARGALELARSMFGPEHRLTLMSMNEVASTLYERDGRSAEAESVWREALDLSCDADGQETLITARIMNNLGQLLGGRGRLAEAQDLLERNVELVRRLQGELHPAYATSLMNLAILYEQRRRFADADTLYQRGLAALRSTHGDRHPDVGKAYVNIANLCRTQQRFEEAERFARKALTLLEDLRGPRHADVGSAVHVLGTALFSLGRHDEAAECARRAIDIITQVHGSEHDQVLAARGVLAAIAHARGDLHAALAEMRVVHAVRVTRLGEDDVRALGSLGNIGQILCELGRLDEAEPVLRIVYEKHRAKFGDRNAGTLHAILKLAPCLQQLDKLDEAESLARAALDGLRDGPQPVTWAIAANRLASILIDRERFADAEPFARESIAVGGPVLAHDAVNLARFRSDLGRALRGQGRDREALDELLPAYDVLRPVLTEMDGEIRDARAGIVAAYEALGDQVNAARWRSSASNGP